MQKYIISVSKKNNSIWKIYFYDENFQIHSERINPLLIWYYKLRKRHRVKGVCSECGKEIHFLSIPIKCLPNNLSYILCSSEFIVTKYNPNSTK